MNTTAAWEKARVELARERLRRKASEIDAVQPIWTPYPNSPQQRAIDSEADIVGFGGQAGGGKALALDTPMPTPSGWTTMGDVLPGDSLLDEHGRPCRVLVVSDVMHGHECYELQFDSRRITETMVADADHRWLTETHLERRTPAPGKVRTTAEIASSLYASRYATYSIANHAIRVNDPDRSHRYIVACRPVPSVPVKCVGVDSPSHLFLAGRSMVPTHNTDLILGLGVTQHRNSIIFRKEYPQFRSMIERANEIIGDRGRFNGQEKVFRLKDGRRIELGAVQYDQEKGKYRGRPHDLKAYDEATEILESVFWFTMGWLRTTTPGQRCRALLTFNPPSDANGRWVLRLFAPWLDRKFANPAMPGELRYFARVSGELVWRPNGDTFVHNGETIVPKSITFFPSKLSDNPILAATGYGSQLQSLPEPLRSQLLYGDFDAGVQDSQWQVIPTAWVEAAMARWREMGGDAYSPDVKQTAIGVDVAHGGSDKTVLAPRWGRYVGRLLSYAGSETPDGKSAAALVVAIHEPGALINVDAIGYGAPCYEKLHDAQPEGYEITTAWPINFGERSDYTDRSERFRCVNKRAEAYWRMRDALDPENDADLALPDDPELLADLTAPTYKVTPSGIQVEPKDEIKQRLGRSPDKGDAATLCVMPEPGEIVKFY